MAGKKYILTDETLEWKGRTLYRIQAIRDFNHGYVKKGDIGGFVESERNLSQRGNCWIYNNAKAYDSGLVLGDASLNQEAEIFENATIQEYAGMFKQAKLFGKAKLHDFAEMSDNAIIYGHAIVSGNAFIRKNAHVSGWANITYNMRVLNNALITGDNDIFCAGPIGSRNSFVTFYRAIGDGIWVSCGCFNDSLDSFERAVHEKHRGTGHEERYMKLIELARMM